MPRYNWTPEFDATIIETVNEFLKEGRTRKDAFIELSKDVGWDWAVIKNHHAFLVREEKAKVQARPADESIDFLQLAINDVQAAFRKKDSDMQALEGQLEELSAAYTDLQTQYMDLREDYDDMLRLLEKARRLAVGEDETVTLRMDKSGNLERTL